MKDADLLLVRAQVGLAFFFSFGFIGAVFVMVFFNGTLSQTANTLLTGLLGVLGTIVTQQMNYFYARQRTLGLSDPSQIVTQTHTSADGAVTKIQSPAASTTVIASPLVSTKESP